MVPRKLTHLLAHSEIHSGLMEEMALFLAKQKILTSHTGEKTVTHHYIPVMSIVALAVDGRLLDTVQV